MNLSGKICLFIWFFGLLSNSILLSVDAETMYSNNSLRKPFLYAPHREQYSSKSHDKSGKESDKCFICMLGADSEENDQKNLLITRFKYHNLLMNLYPYQKGHMLLVPKRHVKDLSELCAEEKMELMQILSAVNKILKEVLNAGGTNIGVNIGKIAGASKPDHLHIHIIPRYKKEDIGFIHTVCDTQLISYDVQKLYKILKDRFDKLRDEFCDCD